MILCWFWLEVIMGIKEDIEDLKHQIKRSISSRNTEQTANLLKMSFEFCEKIKDNMANANEGELKNLTELMMDFRDFLNVEMN